MMKNIKGVDNFGRPSNGTWDLNIAIAGGGALLEELLALLDDQLIPPAIRVTSVWTEDPEDLGAVAARSHEIQTVGRLADLFKNPNPDAVVILMDDPATLSELFHSKPKETGVLDYALTRRLISLASYAGGGIDRLLSQFLVRQISERVVVLQPDFTIVEANPGYLEAVSRRTYEVIGAKCYEVTHGLDSPCSEFHPEIGCPLVKTMETGEPAHVIHMHPVSKANAVYCDLSTYPIKNRKGEIIEVVEIWRDITDAISPHWERRLQALKSDLGKLFQEDRLISLGKLAASCAHEINNPIQGILTLCDLMLEVVSEGEPTHEEMVQFKENLCLMSKELERCGEIVSGLLSFSREQVVEKGHVDLNAVIESVFNLTKHRMALQNIKATLALSQVPFTVWGDPNKLQQCFLNLVFNAIEAMPNGGELRVSTKLIERGKSVCAEVRDIGCGISEENIGRIFDPFFTTKEVGKGTGLGLSIVYGIVKAQGGHIEAESAPGKGAAFRLTFPTEAAGEGTNG